MIKRNSFASFQLQFDNQKSYIRHRRVWRYLPKEFSSGLITFSGAYSTNKLFPPEVILSPPLNRQGSLAPGKEPTHTDQRADHDRKSHLWPSASGVSSIKLRAEDSPAQSYIGSHHLRGSGQWHIAQTPGPPLAWRGLGIISLPAVLRPHPRLTESELEVGVRQGSVLLHKPSEAIRDKANRYHMVPIWAPSSSLRLAPLWTEHCPLVHIDLVTCWTLQTLYPQTFIKPYHPHAISAIEFEPKCRRLCSFSLVLSFCFCPFIPQLSHSHSSYYFGHPLHCLPLLS